jgi:histidine triad (HIT) family protein
VSECLFCRIIEGEIPSKKLFEDDRIIAFRDINPKAPTHILIIPKSHFASLEEVPADREGLLGHILLKAREIARDEGVSESGYRIVLNTGPDSGQDVFHIHFHLLAGRRMTWPPG